ncbi:MAG: single-stranded DNA-binding protein [Alphaproteobacteria bacterium]|nr:single-stranded DNA-binding protein [Alphaproteobacteria bacterium]
MAGSLNKVTLIGNLGADPDVRTMSNGGEVCNLSVATTESWKDKNTGERRDKTEWHRVVVFSPGLVTVCKNYLKKGSKVYLEGALETRSWEQDGQKRYSTEVVLKNFNSTMLMLDGRGGAGGMNDNAGGGYDAQPMGGGMGGAQASAAPAPIDELEDEIPF